MAGAVGPPRARLRTAIGRPIIRRAVAGLPLRVQFPDGTSIGAGGAADPVMVIHRADAFFARLATDAKIGFGEAYMAGDWDTGPGTDLADLLTPLASNVATLVPEPLQRFRRLVERRQPAGEQGTPSQARQNIHRHYDLSNDLFASFLDETLSYSSAMFGRQNRGASRDGDDLAAAQRRKIDAILDLAAVGPGCEMLEIGTGWGELAIQAAQRGAHVTTVTLSTEQRDLALRRVAAAGVSGPGPRPPRRLPRGDRPVRRDRQRRDGRSGRTALLARLLRNSRPAPHDPAAGSACNRSPSRTTGCSPPRTRTPGSTSTSSRAGSSRRSRRSTLRCRPTRR